MRPKEKRKKQAKMRKNFLPTLIIIILLWSSIAFLIYFVDPFNTGAIPLFFLLFFLSLLFTLSLTFANTRRGLLTSLGLTLFLMLRYFGIGNLLNFLLIFGLLITCEFYFLNQ